LTAGQRLQGYWSWSFHPAAFYNPEAAAADEMLLGWIVVLLSAPWDVSSRASILGSVASFSPRHAAPRRLQCRVTGGAAAGRRRPTDMVVDLANRVGEVLSCAGKTVCCVISRLTSTC